MGLSVGARRKIFQLVQCLFTDSAFYSKILLNDYIAFNLFNNFSIPLTTINTITIPNKKLYARILITFLKKRMINNNPQAIASNPP